VEILFLFFILFGVGAVLGLAYVGVVAIYRTIRGSIWFAKEMKRANGEAWAKAKADHAAAQAKKAEKRARALP